jgi:hypothetical protein
MANGNRRRKTKEAKDGEVQRLKNVIRRLESDKRKLLSELKTYEAVFQHNMRYISKKIDDENLTVEDVIKAANKKQTIQQAAEEKEQTIDDMVKKWQCWKCKEGVMKLVIYENRVGKQYFRRCTTCKKMTDPQLYHDKVTGVRD